MPAREQFDDPRFVRMQDRIKALEDRLGKIPFADGSLVEDQAVTTSATTVNHRLGRKPNGCIVLRAAPDSALGFSAIQPIDETVAVNLEASANATFDLWFW